MSNQGETEQCPTCGQPIQSTEENLAEMRGYMESTRRIGKLTYQRDRALALLREIGEGIPLCGAEWWEKRRALLAEADK